MCGTVHDVGLLGQRLGAELRHSCKQSPPRRRRLQHRSFTHKHAPQERQTLSIQRQGLGAQKRSACRRSLQEAQRKASQLSGVRWHLIGHLQHNKVNAAVRFADVIHSLDSAELIEHVDRACLAAGRSIEGLLQIRLGGEESKSGIDPEDLNALLEALSLNAPRSLRLVGLMTIPPPCAEAAESRRYFVMLRDILADISARGYSFWQGRELSMGMSCDYIEAIKAGATYIRVGRALFGERRTGNGRH